jgi:hypothetical protein
MLIMMLFLLPVCGEESLTILHDGEASFAEVLAAREIQRYLYLRTGALAPVMKVSGNVPEGSPVIIVARKDRGILSLPALDPELGKAIGALAEQQYLLQPAEASAGLRFLVAGGGDPGTLHAAYRLAEHLGARFYLHGDVVPDARIDTGYVTDYLLPGLEDGGAPLFDLRGIQPFHDFPEGPDWWNLDDYKAVLSQLPKLRMNFFGLHTYPEGHPNAEPTVWIGLPEEIGGGSNVKAAYPSSYQNTLRGNWGYAPTPTGAFHYGASLLFEHDAFGSDVMLGHCPRPDSEEDSIEVFRRAGELLGEAFRHARRLGIKICVGTETPLTVPARVKERLEAAGMDPADPAVIGKLYEGIFQRAAQAYPLDYYWFWTPEGWTWSGVSDEQVEATIDDMMIAVEAAKRIKAPFQLATCGWVLGPPGDRALFDEVLPPGMPVSCINRQVGNTPVDEGFREVQRRPKWAIPWLEDDPGLTSPQLWVGRMRRDAADARRYGCTGLMGIHWRTRVLGPAVSALAKAAWDQEPWNSTPDAPPEPQKEEGPRGGAHASFPGRAIEGTDDDPLYRTVRYNVESYAFEVPDGAYRVTLKFCEPHYGESGKRVFGVKLEGRPVIEGLDIFAQVGKDRALDFTFDDVAVSDGWLDVDFTYDVEYPSIAAIAVEGASAARKVNCGGPACNDYAADWPAPLPERGYLPAGDFYADWALSQFGPAAGPEAAKIFETLDGNLPRSSDWVGGPGGLRPDPRPWPEAEKAYAFVDELAALRPLVKGAGPLERFDYWMNTFAWMRAQSKVRCLWAEYGKAMEQVKAGEDAAAKADLARRTALPLREKMVAAVREVYAHMLPLVSNPGEMGNVANWEQHILPSLLLQPGEELVKILGEPLPEAARLGMEYEGPPRIIVPTQRTGIDEGETLSLKVIVLAKEPMKEGAVYWRPMGTGDYERAPLKHVARGVHTAQFPPGGAEAAGLEYHVKAVLEGGEELVFPASAPAMNHTLVAAPWTR